jgi:cobalt-zinc-cadmium efflux system outer membrane protein
MNVSAYFGTASLSRCRLLAGGLAFSAYAATAAWSQSGAQAEPLDLAAALQLARSSGPLRKLADAREMAGTGRVGESGQWPNPNIEWRRENLGSSLQPDIFATAYIPLDLTGRRLALRQATGAGRQRVQADAMVERREAEVEVARAWLQAAGADGMLAIATRQLEALTEIADVDATRLREGLVSEAVGLRTQLEADRARVALVAATADAARARARLARVLGLPAEALPVLAVLAAPPMPAAPDSGIVRGIALGNRPDVRARESALREAQRRYTAERRGLIGDMQLQGGTKQTSGFMTGQIGLSMPFPLFNRNDAARQRSRGEYAEALALRDDMINQVQGSVGAAWRAYVASRHAASAASTFDARGREIARIARVAYSEGHVTLTELLDAERAATDAMNTHLRWAADAWLSRLEFERALGARLDASSPLDLPLLATLLTTGS